MAAYNKFNGTITRVFNGEIDFDAHTFKVMLTNVAPVATNNNKADLTEISAGNGYTAGGPTSTVSSSTGTGGTHKVVTGDCVVTAAGGSIGPFRYAVYYDDSHANDALIAWWDYGSSITLADGESFTIDFDGTNGLLTAV